MKKLILALSLLIPSIAHADSITPGNVGLLIPSTGVIDTSRRLDDKYNSNFKIIAASMTGILDGSLAVPGAGGGTGNTQVYSEEGSPLGGNVTSVDLVGPGITGTQSGTTVTITVTATGGGSDNIGSHISTRTLVLPFGFETSSGVVVSSLTVMGVITSTSGFVVGNSTLTSLIVANIPSGAAPVGLHQGLVFGHPDNKTGIYVTNTAPDEINFRANGADRLSIYQFFEKKYVEAGDHNQFNVRITSGSVAPGYAIGAGGAGMYKEPKYGTDVVGISWQQIPRMEFGDWIISYDSFTAMDVITSTVGFIGPSSTMTVMSTNRLNVGAINLTTYMSTTSAELGTLASNFSTWLSTTQAVIKSTAANLSSVGTINTSDNPVSWTKLKDVPAAFADGTDDGGGSGSSDVQNATIPVTLFHSGGSVFVATSPFLAVDGLAKLFAVGSTFTATSLRAYTMFPSSVAVTKFQIFKTTSTRGAFPFTNWGPQIHSSTGSVYGQALSTTIPFFPSEGYSLGITSVPVSGDQSRTFGIIAEGWFAGSGSDVIAGGSGGGGSGVTLQDGGTIVSVSTFLFPGGTIVNSGAGTSSVTFTPQILSTSTWLGAQMTVAFSSISALGTSTQTILSDYRAQFSTTGAQFVGIRASTGAMASNFSTWLSTTQAVIKSTAANLSTLGTINTESNPVSWTKLKDVPAGFADGTDDGGAGGGSDNLGSHISTRVIVATAGGINASSGIFNNSANTSHPSLTAYAYGGGGFLALCAQETGAPFGGYSQSLTELFTFNCQGELTVYSTITARALSLTAGATVQDILTVEGSTIGFKSSTNDRFQLVFSSKPASVGQKLGVTQVTGNSYTIGGVGDAVGGAAGGNGSIGMTFDNGTSVLEPTTSYITVPYSGTITGWTIISNSTGSVVVDVKKCAGFLCNPTISIAGTEKPTISADWANEDSSLSSWTTTVTAGDKFGFNIDSVSTIKNVSISLTVAK